MLLGAAVARFLWETRALVPQSDDAYISYVYARNLVEGNGLVFNFGEYVEGFTNLLWTLLVAGGLRLGLQAELVGHILGVCSGVGVLVATYWYARTDLPESRAWLAGLAPWLVLSSVSFALWSTSGMETPLFVALVTVALAAQIRGRMGWAAVAVALATLTRPDGVILGAVLFGAHLLAHRLRGLRAWAPPLSYAAVLVLLTLFRLVYYGALLPNTFYAKVGGIPIQHGIDYTIDFLIKDGLLILLPGVLCVVRDRKMWPGAVFVLVTIAYVISIGGDAFKDSRFLLPALPCLAVFCVHGIARAFDDDRVFGIVLTMAIPAQIGWSIFRADSMPVLAGVALVSLGFVIVAWRRLRWIQVAVLVGLAALTCFDGFTDFRPTFHGIKSQEPMPTRFEALQIIHHYKRITYRLSANSAMRLRAEWPPPHLVAAVGVGVLGYVSRLPILDLVGLLDPVVARTKTPPITGEFLLPGHQRSNADYILHRRPDFIVIPRKGGSTLPAILVLRESPEFKANYRWDERIKAYRRIAHSPRP